MRTSPQVSRGIRKKCPYCQRMFNSGGGYRDHVKSHEGVFRYTCSYCSRGFVAKKNYMEHLALHTGDCYFACKMCDAKFKNHYQLKVHQVKELHEPKFGRSGLT